MTVSSTPKSSRNRRRICLLLDTAEFAYQNELLLGVHEQCRARDVDVYCLSGGGIAAARAGQSLYELVGPGDFDGIIMSTGTMVHDESTEELHAFLSRFGQTPTVSLSTAVPEIASVIVDNQTSVRELTKHLIETHGKRRIGFVRVHSPEGEQRFEGYQEALFDHGIPLDPALIFVGDFTWESGVQAVRVLFDERNAGCDALVGSNDWIAMGAMQALEQRGLKVPRDVAVTGFDDVEDARFADPPLTSVSQPVRELGVEAARLVLGMILGERVPMVKPVHTKLKLRQSCGCGLPKSQGMGSLSPGWEGPASTHREPAVERWANTMRRASPRSIAQIEGPWAEDLASALDADLSDRTEEAFLGQVAKVVGSIQELDSMPEWHDVIQVLRASCVPRLRDDSLRWAKAESLFERAHLLVAATAERVQGQRRIELQDMLKLLNDISRGTRHLYEDEQVFRVLVAHMSRLKIPSFYLGRAPSPLAADGEARLLLAYDTEHGARLPEPAPFRAGQWLPTGYGPSQRHTVVVQLFSFGDGSHGFCVSEMGPTVGILYESVREMINAGIQSAHLLRQCMKKT